MSQHCNICGEQRETSLVSSGVAPVTYGWCSDCQARGAENIGVVSLWIASFGGPDKAPDFRKQLISFVSGEYVGWDSIRDHYLRNEEAIVQSFKEEFSLNDDKPS